MRASRSRPQTQARSSFSPNGEFEELTANDVEPLQFVYTVSDQAGATSEPVVAVIAVPGVNDDPVANDETSGGQENQQLTIDVLSNDTDVDRNDGPSNFSLTQAQHRISQRRVAGRRNRVDCGQPTAVCAGHKF